jgi:hypothetical protein
MASHPGKKIVGGQMWDGRTGKRTPVEWHKGLEHYQKHLFAHNDIDVFMHTPSVDVDQELTSPKKPYSNPILNLILLGQRLTKIILMVSPQKHK